MDNKNQNIEDKLVQRLEELERAIVENPSDVKNYLKRGFIKSELDNNEGALEDYNKAIELDGKYASAYNNRGNVKVDLGDIEGALEDYTKTIELNEKHTKAYYNRGVIKSDLGDKEGALEDYTKAIELDEKYTKAYYNRGVIKSYLGDKEGALEDYTKAIKLNEKDASTYYNRGNVRDDLGDKEGALEDYTKAIELNEKDASAYNNRGVIKSGLGDKEGALKDYTKAIELDGKNASAYNNRGILKRRMIEYEDFLKEYEELSVKIDRHPALIAQIAKIKSGFKSSIKDLKKAAKLDKGMKLFQNNLQNTEEILNHFEFEISLNPQTQTGYLVFADIMGWKGIWQKKDFDENTTLKTMLRIKRRLLKIETVFELKVNLISDTFVIFSNQLELISNACKILIESCLESNLLIRGAMAYGTYYNLETVYVGPTVDEAASWHEKAEEVVIMCTTSARREIVKSDSNALKKAGMVERVVCTKQGKIKTYIVDWYTEKNKEKFLNIMDSTQVYPELYSKYINTENALNEILDKKSNGELSLKTNGKITV